MPLSEPAARREARHRLIDMRVYARDDGLYDIEARLVDRKTFDFERLAQAAPVPAGQPLHDISLRMTVDGGYVVRAIEASSDVTPYPLCKEAENTLQGLGASRSHVAGRRRSRKRCVVLPAART